MTHGWICRNGLSGRVLTDLRLKLAYLGVFWVGKKLDEVALSPAETETLYLRDVRKMTWAKIGDMRGVHRGSAMNTYNQAKTKVRHDLKETDKDRNYVANLQVEAGEASIYDTRDDDEILALAVAAGVGDRSMTDKGIVSDLDSAIDAVGFFIRHDVRGMATASYQEKVRAWALLIDKRQLLRGEPTAIMRVQDIRKLDEVGALLKSELERRGLVIEGEVVK